MTSGDNNNNNNNISKGIRIERYVPSGIDSLQSDVPGYYGRTTRTTPATSKDSQQNDSDRTTTTTTTADDVVIQNNNNNEYRGPICWKCNGTGINKKRPRSELSSNNNNNINNQTDTTTSTIITTTTSSCCTVCKGVGRIESHRNSNNNDNNANKYNRGLITRGRQKSITYQSNSNGPQPAGYNVPYWGDRVKKATYNCEDQYIDDENTTATNDNTSKDSIAGNRPVWLPKQDEQLCNLVGEWRILQEFKSHRWTTDDLITAYVAAIELSLLKKTPAVNHDDKKISLTADTNKGIQYLDLGTGNGSVLQMVLWSSMKVQFQQRQQQTGTSHDYNNKEANYITYARGLEARSEAMQLAQRSIQFNIGTSTSSDSSIVDVQVVHTDFRSYFESSNDMNHRSKKLLFDLITGTPPYFRVDFEVVETTTTTTTTENIPTENINQPNDESPTTGSEYDYIPKTNEDNNVDNSGSNKERVQHVVQAAIIRQGGMPTSYQSAPARCEFRGGIEEYCYVASQQLQPNTGRFIVCLNHLNHHRALTAFRTNNLVLHKIYYIRGKLGRNILFCVYVLSKPISYTTTTNDDANTIDEKFQSPKDDDTTTSNCTNKQRDDAIAPPYEEIHLAVRDYNGDWTQQYKDTVLQFMAIPTPNP